MERAERLEKYAEWVAAGHEKPSEGAIAEIEGSVRLTYLDLRMKMFEF
jgi:hypothetical protein